MAEFAIVLPLMLVFCFFYVDFCLWMVDENVAHYAAFMAARTYQVVGRLGAPDGVPIFKHTAQEIIKTATPSATVLPVELTTRVDTEFSPTGELPTKFPIHPLAGFTGPITPLPGPPLIPADLLSAEASTCLLPDVPRFGLLKIEYPYRRRFGLNGLLWSAVNAPLGMVTAYAPYRLEKGVKGCCTFGTPSTCPGE